MRTPKRYFLLAGVLGLSAAVLPAFASSETSPTVEARSTPGGIYEHHEWAPAEVSIGQGATVTFDNPTTVPHGIEWVGGPGAPTCDSGVPVGTTVAASGTDWKGSCTFTKPGTYVFYCTVHGPEMTGRVVVSADGTTTTTTTTPGGSTGTTTAPTSTAPKSEEAPSGPPLTGTPAVKAGRHGTSVTGSLQVTAAGAGDRLEVALIVSGSVLGKGKHPKHVTVGRSVHSAVKAGRQSFTVKLDASARRALARRHRLALSVEVVLSPSYGNPVTRTRSLVVHG